MNDQKLGWFVWLEIAINQLAMSVKSFMIVIFVGLFFQLATVGVMLLTGLISFQNQTLNFGVLKLYISNFPDILFGDQVAKVMIRAYAERALVSISDDLFKMFIYSSPILLAVVIIAHRYIKGKTDGFGKSEFLRGSKLINEVEMIKKMKGVEHNFKLGNIPVPKSVETSHLMVIGSAGSGKTQIAKPNIKLAVENIKFKNVVHDIKGDWTSELFNKARGDMIFNPMDSRSMKWTLWNDLEDITDIKNFCLWLIPEAGGKADPFWNNSARMILESIMLYLWQKEMKLNSDLRQMLNMGAEELAAKIEGYGKGAEFAQKKDSFLTLQAQMAFIDFLEDGPFSIRQWIRDEENGGTIFLLNSEKTDAIMRPVLSLFVNFMASEVLSLPDDLARRIYFWLDEFTALQKLQKVIDLLKLGRSKGASVWLLFQDFQQVEKIYSKEDMRTVINNTASIAVLQLKEPTAAKFFADRFGKQEHRIKSNTTSMGVANNRDGLSLADQIRDDYIVKDSEILNLQSLHAYVMIKDIDGIAKTTIPVTQLPIVNSTFMQRSLSKAAQIELLKRQQAAAALESQIATDNQLSNIEEEHLKGDENAHSDYVQDFENKEF